MPVERGGVSPGEYGTLKVQGGGLSSNMLAKQGEHFGEGTPVLGQVPDYENDEIEDVKDEVRGQRGGFGRMERLTERWLRGEDVSTVRIESSRIVNQIDWGRPLRRLPTESPEMTLPELKDF